MEPNYSSYNSKRQVVVLAFELGYIIALPILVLGLLGKYLDNRYATNPVFKIIGLLLAIAASSFWLYKRFSEVFKSMNSHNKDNH